MTNDSDVTVQQAIVHITDRNKPAPLYSEIDLDLVAHAALRNYFTGQVRNALEDETNAASFATAGAHDARDACNRILERQEELIPASQQLAQLLHAAMGTHHRTVSGLLAVCVYSQVSDRTESRHLALIKLDPGSGLVQKVEKQRGKQLITFDVLDNVMPTTREKLQKAALLPPPGSEKYDLLLLDRQTPEVAAAFWAEAFLNAKLIVDGKLGARTLRDVSYRASDDMAKRGLVTAAEAEAVKEHTDVVLQTPRVKRSAFVQGLPISKEAKSVVAAELEKKFGGTKTIPIDTEYAKEKLTKITRYRGAYSFRLEVESEHWDDVVKDNKPFDGAGGVPMTRLVLEVPQFQKVK